MGSLGCSAISFDEYQRLPGRLRGSTARGRFSLISWRNSRGTRILQIHVSDFLRQSRTFATRGILGQPERDSLKEGDGNSVPIDACPWRLAQHPRSFQRRSKWIPTVDGEHRRDGRDNIYGQEAAFKESMHYTLGSPSWKGWSRERQSCSNCYIQQQHLHFSA